MNRRLILLAAAGAVCVPLTAAAQVPTVATKVCGPYAVTVLAQSELDDLTALYDAGRWRPLQQRARKIVREAGNALPGRCDQALLNDQANYIALTWIGQDPLKGKPQLMRVIVHWRATGSYVADLPGIRAGRLVELFLGRSMAASLTSLYTSTREDNPAASQLPAFVQAVAGPLFATFAAIVGPPGVARGEQAPKIRPQTAVPAPPPPPPLIVVIYDVGLPLRRASVHLQANASDAVDGADFDKALLKMAASVRAKEAAYSDRARTYADDVAKGLTGVRAETPACGEQAPDPAACMQAFDEFLQQAYKGAVAGASRDDVRAVQAVDQKFRDLIKTAGTATADLDITFHNRPLTHWSYGAGSAVIGKAWLTKPRVKLDDSGNLKADPLTRVMTMAFVNWSPAGYDEQADHMRTPERWRVFFGAALTPDFGPIGGLNLTLVRGIGLTIGGGVLFAKGADPADIGKAPPSSTDPFRLSVAKIAFAGISYNFK